MSQSMRTKLALANLPKPAEPRTLLQGKHYDSAATHSDPRAFQRMVKYGLKLKERK